MTSAGTALKLGFTQAASRWATGLFAVLATVVEVIAQVIGVLGGLCWVEGDARTGPIALAAGFVCALCGRLMLALVQGGAIRQSAAWLKGQGTGTTLEEMFTAAPRSLAWFLWMLPVELFAMLWKWLGLAALLLAYGRAFAAHRGAVSAAAALAMFLTLSLPLALGWAGLRRAALVSAVRDEVGPWVASTRALAALGGRPGAHLVVLLVGVAGAVVSETVLSVFGSAVSRPELMAVEPMIAGQLAIGALVAFTAALFDLVILYGFTALDLPPKPPIPAAQPRQFVLA
jgi:hypothetical protein